LRKGAVHTDGDDVGASKGAQSVGHVAQFCRADAGVSERKEKQQGVFLAEITAEFHVHQAGFLLRFEGEIRGFGSNG